MKVDAETDPTKRVAIGTELVESLTPKASELPKKEIKIEKELQPLAEEAKKYKNAGEFITALFGEGKKTSEPLTRQFQKELAILATQNKGLSKKMSEREASNQVLANFFNKATKKTQTEVAKETVKEGAKTIKQVSEETEIKEPNIRRILGVGEKEGTFTRVEKGVYVLNNGKEDIAFIHTGDAVDTLPKLAKDGFKADMIFLDIPYNTPAVKGGSRGVKYDLLSVADFKKVMSAVSDIVKTEDTPVYYMFSQAKSGMTAMLKYNDVLTETGFKPIAKGDVQKLFSDGKPVTNVRGVVAQPEGLLLLNKSGVFNEKEADRNLDFALRRPKGYSTEKPAELLRSLIMQGTKKGDTVLDPFAGSGVAGAEAVKSGRKAVLVEKNKEVAEKVTKPRVEKAIEETKKPKQYPTIHQGKKIKMVEALS